MESSKDSGSSDSANVEVRLFVLGKNTWPLEGHSEMELIKHFSSFGKVPFVIAGGPRTKMSVVYLTGEDAVVKNVEKLNGGCECNVEGGCKFLVDEVFPLRNKPRINILPCGYFPPGFRIEMGIKKPTMAKKAKKATKPEPMKPKKKAKK